MKKWVLCSYLSLPPPLSLLPFHFIHAGDLAIATSNKMTKRRQCRRQAPIYKNFDSLKRFYNVAPLATAERRSLLPTYSTVCSRRGALASLYTVGSPREQYVCDIMRTCTPLTCTKEVVDLYLEVAALVSVYCSTAEYMEKLPEI
ncbi:hypothetical protein STCU_00345 [Strigomonas culicis]|uniref:Uncharacterized protein n=1 Tax=Strigomonas culicis TaxID=28005 RepID=S9WCQ1_9TRYP|nr:hypothetical protein STCU_00345 [Strigomonas culicis]|eukprot:EPY36911.1 hypothetical protein STCU_00345 [Strigomonas culicis]